MTLSILILAYNVENFIELCIKSCLDQDLEPSAYEVIVVNDGSTDQTEEKSRILAQAYPNVQLISQANKGLGGARNTGIKQAKGDYVYLLDADDYIAKQTLGTLIKGLEYHQPDILGFLSKNVVDDRFTSSSSSDVDITSCTVLNGLDFLGSQGYKPEVWWYFIKKSFYLKHNMGFIDKKHVQDAYFTPTLISKAERVVRIPYDVHRYRTSNISITRNRTDAHLKIHLKDLCYAIEQLYKLRHHLINEGVTHTEALKCLHIKQQRYVFIAITRFMRTSLKPSELKPMLDDFRAIDAYPLHVYLSSLNFKDPLNLGISFIFNQKFLLYSSVYAFRVYKKLRTALS